MFRRVLLALFAAALLAPAAYAMSGAEVLKKLNHDGDQTLEMPEAIAAAASTFDQISKDKGQTVTRPQVADRVSESDWTRVNKDNDQTLEMDEWLEVARTRFTAADANHDGKLDAAELNSPAGQSLVKMMVK